MKRTNRWMASFTIACTLLSSQSMVYADWTTSVHTENKKTTIANGVEHEKILSFTDQGWLNLNVLRIDLNEKYNELELLTNEEAFGTKSKLSDLASQNPNTIGAINGDFFDMKRATTLGPVVKNGELFTTPYYLPNQMATFNVTKDKTPFVDYWSTPKLQIVHKDFPIFLDFVAINKNVDNPNTAILFNSTWGETTPSLNPPAKVVEMIVHNNKVEKIVSSNGGSTIPEDGYILWATGSYGEHISQSFMLEDEVELVIESTPNWEDLSLTIGGGATLVKSGTPQTVFTHELKGNHPRTAMGISENREELIFLTIDGRTSSYTGVSQKELGEIMKSLGSYEAINLDGGGSTEMILRPLGEERQIIANHPSEGYERAIVNGIGVVNTAPKSSRLEGITIETEDTNIFVGTSRAFTLKGYDKNYNPAEIHMDRVYWSVKGVSGYFKDNQFIPSSSGKGKITARYKGESTTIDINVLDNPVGLKLSPSKLTMNAHRKVNIEGFLVDKEGYKAQVSLKDLKLDMPYSLGSLDEKGTFTASESGSSGIIKASFKGLTTELPVAIGYDEKIIDDFEKLSGAFLSYPQEVTGDYTLSSNSKEGHGSGELSYDFTKTDASRAAYVAFDNGGIPFHENLSKIGMWVYGDGNGHWLRGKIVDENGSVYTLNFSTHIDWTGWKYVETPLPTQLKTPFLLERIYLVQTDVNVKNAGKIYIDNLTGSYPMDLPAIDTNKAIDNTELQTELLESEGFQYILNNGLMDNTVENQRLTELDNHLFIRLDNSKGGLRRTDFSQWSTLLETLNENHSENLYILLPKPLSFKDKLEEKLFKDTLKKYKEENMANVWVLSSDVKEFNITPEEGIRYVTYAPLPTDLK